MRRSIPIVALALCCFLQVAAARAQSVPMLTVNLPSPPQDVKAALKESGENPIGAISLGYLYLGAQANTGAWTWHLHGFYGIPQVNVTPWLGFIGDFVSTTNTGANAHEKVEAFLGGPVLTAWSKKKISPFAFGTAGKTRDSKAGTITSLPAFAVGGGLQYKLSKRVGLLFVPGEYVRSFPATGADLNNFTARFGIVLPITK